LQIDQLQYAFRLLESRNEKASTIRRDMGRRIIDGLLSRLPARIPTGSGSHDEWYLRPL
jgi:hypothetical protein